MSKVDLRNPLLRIKDVSSNRVRFLKSVPLNYNNDFKFKIKKNKFRVYYKKGKEISSFFIDDKYENDFTLIENEWIYVTDVDKKYGFKIQNDIISTIPKSFFKNFIKYSIILHLVIGITFSLYTKLFPTLSPVKVENVDTKRINDLLKKMALTQKKKKIEKPKPKPKPEPKVVEKPKPKVVEKPKPKIKQRKPPKISTKKAPVKQMVVKKGPKKSGGVKKTKVVQKSRAPKKSDIRQLNTGSRSNKVAKSNAALAKSLSFLSSSGKSKFKANSISKSKGGGKRYGLGATGGTKNGVTYLSKVSKEAGGSLSGSIRTRGARSIATGNAVSEGAVRGGANGKALNGIQGKVSASNLYSYGSDGGAFTGGEGLQMSGKGKLSDSAIKKTLQKYISKLQYCYEKTLLYKPDLSGTVKMSWTIKTSGSVSGVKIVKSQLNDAKLHACLSKIIGGISFPRPKGGSVDVNYPFKFSSSSL